MTCSPGEHPHADRPNFTFEDYLAMVRDGEAKFSLSEVSRITGWLADAAAPGNDPGQHLG